MAERLKQSVEKWLASVDYTHEDYIPSEFALEFINFIKLVNGAEGEEDPSPVTHYKMLDDVATPDSRLANMCSRGLAKTTLYGEYFFLYLAVYKYLPNFGEIDWCIYVSDSIENGVKNMRKNLEFRWQNSEFLQEFVPKIKFTDVRWEFHNLDGKILVVKGYGAKAVSLDTQLLTDVGYMAIKDCQVGDSIYGPDGKLAPIIAKSEVFLKPMYEITLEDGRSLKVSKDHINSVVQKKVSPITYNKMDMPTAELLQMPLLHTRERTRSDGKIRISNERLLFIENTKPIEHSFKEVPIDPYTMGLLLGDGSLQLKNNCITCSLIAHTDDWLEYSKTIPYILGKRQVDKRNSNVITRTVCGLAPVLRKHKLYGHGNYKSILPVYFLGSIEQRLELLKGLMDSDGSILINGRMDFSSNSPQLIKDVSSIIRSLGGTAKQNKIGNRIEVWIGINPFKLTRKAARFTGKKVKPLVAIKSIKAIPQEPSQCIAIDSPTHQYLANDYFRTHNTGVRGSKEMGKRPTLAVLDDLISDDDARSPTVIASVEDTVYKAVDHALNPHRNKIIWSGTPFNAGDPLYKAVESGAWSVNVYPVCQIYPCTREEFRSAWPSRFDYDFVKKKYDEAKLAGKTDTFMQELMLQIMNDEDRVIDVNNDIQWYCRKDLLKNRGSYNIYFTTDFAVSDKETADNSVIFVWAINSVGHKFLVDGICKRQLMDANIDDLFRLAQMYQPLGVGIEVSGQQEGFIRWTQREMVVRKVFFNLPSHNNSNKPGIRPVNDKFSRFMFAVPWLKAHTVFLPEEIKDTPMLEELVLELSQVTKKGFKSRRDDCLDGVSQLNDIPIWLPGECMEMMENADSGIWGTSDDDEDELSIQSYVV